MPTLLRAPTRTVRNPVMDSRRWERFEPRDDDIIVATYSKSGTTWTQRIVDMLVHQSPAVRPFGDISLWVDATIFAPLEDVLATLRAQTHRRYVKSHLPFDALPVWEGVKYIHVGRDGRDACISFHNHVQGFMPEFQQRIAANAMALAASAPAGQAPPLGPPPEDPRDFLVNWLDELEASEGQPPGGSPLYFEFEATYWAERRRENLLFVHYNDLKEDLAGEMRRISDFLAIDTPETLMPDLVEAARFETMKRDGDALFPRLSEAFDRGADRFINQGRSGRWKEIAKPEDIARYQAIKTRQASPAMAAWLETGRRGAGDPRTAAD
jgi:aryl sulfotransferase